MQDRKFILAITVAVVTFLTVPLGIAAQDATTQAKKAQHHHYKLIDMGTFGGPSSYLAVDSHVLTDRSVLVGWEYTAAPESQFCFSPTQDGFAQHAFRWRGGTVTDLRALPGGNRSQAVWTTPNGLIVGNSENGEIDPLLPGIPEARAVLWQHGQIVDLGTFGGNESMAAAVNSRGQVVGSALNSTPDPYSLIDFLFCLSSNGTQARAFLWQNGEKQDLGTLGTGNDALAFFINDAGQVAGFSYTNSIANGITGLPTFHPFLWEKGTGMTTSGPLGARLWCKWAISINEAK